MVRNHSRGREHDNLVLNSLIRDDSYDFSNKRVGVIGNGSTALQLVPSLQKDYGHKGMKLVNFIRSPTWVSATYLSEFTKDGGNFECKIPHNHLHILLTKY